MMIHVVPLKIKYGADTNPAMATEKPVFVGKTFKELCQWDFSVRISDGALKPGMAVPECRVFDLQRGNSVDLTEYLASLPHSVTVLNIGSIT